MRGDGRVSVGRGWAAGLAVDERTIVVPQAYRVQAGAAGGARSDAPHTERARELQLQQHGDRTAATAALVTTQKKRLPAFFFPPTAGRVPPVRSPLANAVDGTYPSVARLPGATFPDFARFDARAPLMRGGAEAAARGRSRRFRFRPRIGRGGRIIVDRVRVASRRRAPPRPAPTEIYACPHSLEALPLSIEASTFGTVEPDLLNSLASRLAILETVERRSRIDAIAAMSDSEDEVVEVRLRSERESGSRASYATVAAQCAAAAALAASGSSGDNGGGGDSLLYSHSHTHSRARAPARGAPFVPAHFTWSDDPCELVKARCTVVATGDVHVA